MAKKQKEHYVSKTLSTKEIARLSGKELDGLKTEILATWARESTSISRDKSYAWKDEEESYANISTNQKLGFSRDDIISSQRVFQNADTRMFITGNKINLKDGYEMTAENLILVFDDGIKNGETQNRVFVSLGAGAQNSKIAIAQTNDEKNMNVPDIIKRVFAGQYGQISQIYPRITEELSENYGEDKVKRVLESINPKFAEMWDMVLGDETKAREWFEREDSPYKKLEDAMNKKVTTEGVKKAGGLFSKFFAKNKEKDAGIDK